MVLAGGAARRMGGVDKPAQDVGGTSLLQRAVSAVTHARRTVVVGPARPLDREVVWCLEQPPGGGPVAAIAAGLAHVDAPVVVVLAADLPAVAPAVPRLLAALDASADLSALVDGTGRVNYLAAAWRTASLRRAIAALPDPAGAPVRGLLAGLRVVGVADGAGWARDCDTWDDLSAARQAEQGSTP